jgi:hypothetical protein
VNQSKIDELLLAKALAIASDPDSTVAQMEWVRKFLNDHESRHQDDSWKPEDPAATAASTYGIAEWDLPTTSQEVVGWEVGIEPTNTGCDPAALT